MDVDFKSGGNDRAELAGKWKGRHCEGLMETGGGRVPKVPCWVSRKAGLAMGVTVARCHVLPIRLTRPRRGDF